MFKIRKSTPFLEIDPENSHTCCVSPNQPVNGRCFVCSFLFSFWTDICSGGSIWIPNFRGKQNKKEKEKPSFRGQKGSQNT